MKRLFILLLTLWLLAVPVFASTVFDAINQGNMEELKRIVSRDRKTLNQLDEKDNTPVHIAVVKGDKDILEFLIKKRADLNGINMYNLTPLHEAVSKNNQEMVRLLVEHKADMEQRDTFDATPYDHAVANGYEEIAQYLKTRGANTGQAPEAPDYSNPHKTLRSLSIAARKNYPEDFLRGIDNNPDNPELKKILEDEKLCLVFMEKFYSKNPVIAKIISRDNNRITFHYRYQDGSGEFHDNDKNVYMTFVRKRGNWYLKDIK